jgi:hypothetical protein
MKELTNPNLVDQENAKFSLLASKLPVDRPALLAASVEAVQAYHDAVMAGDDLKHELAYERAVERYDAVIWKMNGNTFFGSRARDNSVGAVIEQHCAAVRGTAPKWGQRAEFIVNVEGVRAIVVIRDAMRDHAPMEFHAIDFDRPFISPTGYQSHFFNPRPGKTVCEVAQAAMSHYLKQRRTLIEAEYRERLSLDRFDWIDGSSRAADTYEEEAGQIAFAF